jgi:hypothetical protein
MRLILFFTIISYAAFMFVTKDEVKTLPVAPKEVTEKKTTVEKVIPPVITEVSSSVKETEPVRFNNFWDEIQERWTIEFQDLLTRLDPERSDELYTRYLEAKKAYVNEVTSIVRLREDKGLGREEVIKLMNKADKEYGEILQTIFGKHYNEIQSRLELFQQEIQSLNNDGDYEIGWSL